MAIKIIETGDGSLTLFNEEFDEIYHSRKGALQESLHVFIKNGLENLLKNSQNINILEVGFGTGLNALLTMDYIFGSDYKVSYTGIEVHIVSIDLIKQLNYGQYLKHNSLQDSFIKMHEIDWNINHQLMPNFSIKKVHSSILDINEPTESFDIVYFDAFSPNKQAEMWEIPTLEKVYNILKPQGVLVTYCAKGVFKRNLKTLGFELEILEGPIGKREMIRAIKA